MSVPLRAFADVIEVVLRTDARQAIKYVSDSLTVKVTRKKYKYSGNRPQPRNARNETMLVTFGKPNYREREHIKVLKRAGEPFPVNKIQLRPWPVPRRAR